MTYLSGLGNEDNGSGFRRCSACGEEKRIEDFPHNRAARSGRGHYCKPCHNAIGKRNRERLHGSVRNYMLKHRYGITEEEFEEMLRLQKGRCVVCEIRRAKHVDHDHLSGTVRGILCFRCNGALGQFEENIDWLQLAIEYLESHKDSVSESREPYGVERKTCRDCGESKSVDEFPRNRNSRDGRHCYCKPCHNERGRETKERLYGNSRHYHLTQKYGIGENAVQALIEAQGGRCAVCHVRPAEHVDHDHVTNRVRGVLCGGCNAGMGQFGDDPAVIRRAIDYLERWQDRPDAVQEPPASYILSVA